MKFKAHPHGAPAPIEIEIGKLPEIDFDHDFDFDTDPECPWLVNKSVLSRAVKTERPFLLSCKHISTNTP